MDLEGDRSFKQLLLYLFAFSRGAETRYRLVTALAERPMNTNQLAKELGMDYKAAEHHVRILLQNGLLQTPSAGAYGAPYFLSPLAEGYLPYLREIWSEYGRRQNKEGREKKYIE
jgi:DNA-binding transcriptional ArsR family regulator